jgi:hypothetical protein
MPECLYHGCHAQDPAHAIVWRCPAGHRVVLRYCGDHIDVMMDGSMRANRLETGYGVPVCADCDSIMRLVLEG